MELDKVSAPFPAQAAAAELRTEGLAGLLDGWTETDGPLKEVELAEARGALGVEHPSGPAGS